MITRANGASIKAWHPARDIEPGVFNFGNNEYIFSNNAESPGESKQLIISDTNIDVPFIFKAPDGMYTIRIERGKGIDLNFREIKDAGTVNTRELCFLNPPNAPQCLDGISWITEDGELDCRSVQNCISCDYIYDCGTLKAKYFMGSIVAHQAQYDIDLNNHNIENVTNIDVKGRIWSSNGNVIIRLGATPPSP